MQLEGIIVTFGSNHAHMCDHINDQIWLLYLQYHREDFGITGHFFCFFFQFDQIRELHTAKIKGKSQNFF